LRHSTYHLNIPPTNGVVNKSETKCYWETNGGCKKPNCEFKHELARPDFSQMAPNEVIMNVPPPHFRYPYQRPYYDYYNQSYYPYQRPPPIQRPNMTLQQPSHVQQASNGQQRPPLIHQNSVLINNEQANSKLQKQTKIERPLKKNIGIAVNPKFVHTQKEEIQIKNPNSKTNKKQGQNKKTEVQKKLDFKIKTLDEILEEKKKRQNYQESDLKQEDSIKKVKIDTAQQSENFQFEPKIEDEFLFEEFSDFPDLGVQNDKETKLMDLEELDEFEKEIAEISAL